MDDEIPAVIIDNGSFQIRAGFAGDDAPKVIFPSIAGVQLDNKRISYIGHEAQEKREILALRYPITRGIVTNWEDMEKMWQYTYNELGVTPENQPVVLSDTPFNPAANRDKMAQVMFETFNVPAMYIGIQGALAIYSAGHVFGIAVYCGEAGTHVVPYDEGQSYSRGTARLDLAGGAINEYLGKLLAERGYSSATVQQGIRGIKEKLGYVALDFEQEMKSAASSATLEQSYTLPDGQVVTAGTERFQCAELLFRPSLIGMASPGIHELICNSIYSSPVDFRRTLWGRVILFGGTTLMSGFDDRLEKELAALAPVGIRRVRVETAPERKYSVWIGGSTLASLSSFQGSWVSREEYDEFGPGVVQRCF